MKTQKIVRTPSKVAGGITEDERKEMEALSKLWIKRALRTTPVNVAEITSAIHGIYHDVGLETPNVVVVPSPIVMAFAYGASAAIWHNRKTGSNGATKVPEFNIDQSEPKTSADVIANAAKVCYSIAGKFGLECAAKWSSAYQGGAYWAGYESYLTAFRDILGLRLKEHDKYKNWERAAIAAPFRVMHEKFCIVSDFPEILKIDEQNRPHCADGPSHRWRDGFELYHWRGVKIPDEWIRDKALTPQIALSCSNIEQRRAACEMLGWDRIISELDAKIIDDDNDPEIGVLIEVNLPDSGKEKFLRVQCGTGRMFAIPVPPDMNTALQAQSWTWGIDTSKFNKPEIRT